MSFSNDIDNLVGARLNVGLSTIIGLTLAAGQNSILIRFIAGSSCEIGGASLTWGAGHLWDTTFPLSINSIGTIYFAATGATAQLTYLKGYTPGITVG